MDLARFVFYDKTGDVYMPDVFLEVGTMFALAASYGFKGVNAIDWQHRNDAPQLGSGAPDVEAFDPAAAPELAACANACKRMKRSPRRRSPLRKGSPGRGSRDERGASGGVAKGSKKLKLQRIPSHRFNKSAILQMVDVAGAPVIRMSMQGRRQASDVPSAEVTFGSPADCARVYGEVREPLERDGISVSRV